MARSLYNIINGTGLAVRTAMNTLFGAIQSSNSGSGTPSSTTGYMVFMDTDTKTMKIRNSADNANIPLYTLDETNAVPNFNLSRNDATNTINSDPSIAKVFYDSGTPSTGVISIKIAGLISSTLDFGEMEIYIFQDDNDHSSLTNPPLYKFIIKGNMNSGVWYNCIAVSTATNSTSSINVRFTRDATHGYVEIGETTSTWYKASVVVKNVTSQVVSGYTPTITVSLQSSLLGTVATDFTIATSASMDLASAQTISGVKTFASGGTKIKSTDGTHFATLTNSGTSDVSVDLNSLANTRQIKYITTNNINTGGYIGVNTSYDTTNMIQLTYSKVLANTDLLIELSIPLDTSSSSAGWLQLRIQGTPNGGATSTLYENQRAISYIATGYVHNQISLTLKVATSTTGNYTIYLQTLCAGGVTGGINQANLSGGVQYTIKEIL